MWICVCVMCVYVMWFCVCVWCCAVLCIWLLYDVWCVMMCVMCICDVRDESERELFSILYTIYACAPSIKMLGQKHPCTHNHIIHASYNIVMQWVFLIIKNPWVWPSTPAISFSVHYVSKSYSDYHPCHLFTWYTPLTIYPATLHSKLPLSNSCVTIPHPFLPKFEWAALISCDRGCG